MPDLNHSSQLIENAFTHGPVHPENELVVYENADGLSEILTAGTDGQLYLIRQSSGSITEWSQENQQCPIEPTMVTARTDGRGTLHVAAINQVSMVIATRSRDRAGNWTEWRQLLFEQKIDGPTRLLQLELKENSSGNMELYILYVQRFLDTFWKYSYRIGRADLTATNWKILMFIKGRFIGGPSDVKNIRTSIAFVQPAGSLSLYFYLPNTSTLMAWDNIESDAPVERVVAELPNDSITQFISTTDLTGSTIYCTGNINSQPGLYRYTNQTFEQLGTGNFVDIAGTLDTTNVVNLQVVDSEGGVWHTSGTSSQSFDQLQEITNETSRVNGVYTSSEGQVFVLTGKDLQLRRYLRSPQSVNWELQDIETESTGSEWVMWYNTRITVVDEKKQAVPLHTATLQPDETTVLTINGKTLITGPFQPLEVESDGNGILSFMQPAEELANLWVPTLKLRFEDDPEGQWRSIEATDGTTEQLYNLNGEQLKNAKGRNGTPVLPTDEQGNADALAAQLSACASIGREKRDYGGFTVPEFAGKPDALPLVGFARYTHIDGQINERFDINDVWESIKEGVLSIVGVALETITNGAGLVESIVVTITDAAGRIFETVVEHLSQAFNVIRAIFEEVKIVFETALEWLGYLFDWEKIMQRKDEIKTMISEGITSLPEKINASGIKGNISDAFNNVRANAGIGITAYEGGVGRDSVGQAAETIDFTTLGNIFNEIDKTIQVPVNWLLDRLKEVLPDAGFIAGDLTGPAWTQLENLSQTIQGQITSDIENSVEGITTLFDRIFQLEDPNSLVLNDLLEPFKPVLNGVFTAFENIAIEGINVLERICQPDALLSVLNSPARLPLFSEIYGLINNSSGELPFTVLDFMATLVAIPMHIILEIIEQTNMFDTSSTDCGAWLAAGLAMIFVGIFSAIIHVIGDVSARFAAVVPAFWILALIPLAALTNWSEALQVLALIFYMLYQLIDLILILAETQHGTTFMAFFGIIIAFLLNIFAAVYEKQKEGTPQAVPVWQIVANHVGSITDFARVADLIWKAPTPKPKQAKIVLAIIDGVGMGSLAASAFAEYHFCVNPPPPPEAAT